MELTQEKSAQLWVELTMGARGDGGKKLRRGEIHFLRKALAEALVAANRARYLTGEEVSQKQGKAKKEAEAKQAEAKK